MHKNRHSRFQEPARRPPFVVVVCLKAVLGFLLRLPSPRPTVDWRETATELGARFLVGLVIGAGLCVLLVPVVFWPSRRVPRSLFEQMGEPGWIGWLFLAVLTGTALVWALTSRVSWRDGDILPGFTLTTGGTDLDERVQTGCMGLLLPLALAAYGIYRITHPRKLNRFTGTWRNPEDVVALGICALGIALCVHALGFVPYQRIPLVKYLLAAGGVALFIFGLFWPMAGR